MATCYRKSFASYNKVNIYFYNVDFRRHLLLSKCLLPFYKNNRVAFMIVGGNPPPPPLINFSWSVCIFSVHFHLFMCSATSYKSINPHTLLSHNELKTQVYMVTITTGGKPMTVIYDITVIKTCRTSWWLNWIFFFIC